MVLCGLLWTEQMSQRTVQNQATFNELLENPAVSSLESVSRDMDFKSVASAFPPRGLNDNEQHNLDKSSPVRQTTIVSETVSDSAESYRAAGPKSGYGPTLLKLKTPCWIWQRCVDQDGYGYFRRDRRHVRAHIHYYEQKHGPTPPGLELDHTCRNRRCCNPDHLEPVTHIENCRRGGLVTTGMTIEKAREVRALRAQGVSYNDIAAQMNIGKSLIGQIVTNRCWKESPCL